MGPPPGPGRAPPRGALACLSFLPVVGVVPGLILVRLAIISPLRAYTPAMRGAAARWGNRVATVLLLCLQPLMYQIRLCQNYLREKFIRN